MKLGSAHRAGSSDHRPPGGSVPVPDGYRLLRQLDDLGNCVGAWQVWSAEGPGGFPVALNVISPRFLGGETDHESRDDSLAKSDVLLSDDLGTARHPNLISVFGGWSIDGRLVLASELAESSLWRRYLRATEAGAVGIARDELLEHLAEAAKALDYLARQPRFRAHGRVRPETLRLVGGAVKLDFPLPARWQHFAAPFGWVDGQVYGAPETHSGRHSPLSDQYSLAVVYCHLRGGRPPVPGPEATGTAGGQGRSRLSDLSMLPEEERSAVARALGDDPAERWPSCRAFVEALRTEIQAAEAFAAFAIPRPSGPGNDDWLCAEGRAHLGRSTALTLATATGLTAVAATLTLSKLMGQSVLPGRPAAASRPTLRALGAASPPRVRLQDESETAQPPNAPKAPALAPKRRRDGSRAGPKSPILGSVEPARPEPAQAGVTVVPSTASPSGVVAAERNEPPLELSPKVRTPVETSAQSVSDRLSEAGAAGTRLGTPSLVSMRAGHSVSLQVRVVWADATTPPPVELRVEGLPPGVTAGPVAIDPASLPLDGSMVVVPLTAGVDVSDGETDARLVAVSGSATPGPPLAEWTLRLKVRANPGLEARRRGDEHLRREAFDQAITAFTEALDNNADDSYALHGRGSAYYGKANLARALADLDAAARRRPGDASILNNRGLAHLALNDLDAALADFEAALAVDPTFAVVHYNRGRAYARNNEHGRAIRSYHEAIRLDATFAKALKARGDSLARLGDADQALADYDAAIDLRADSTTLNNRGLLRLKRGEIARALADFDEAIGVNPTNAVTRYNRGRALARLGNLSEAVGAFDHAIRLGPSLARAYTARASANARLGNLAKAEADRNEAAKIQDRTPDADEASRPATITHASELHTHAGYFSLEQVGID